MKELKDRTTSNGTKYVLAGDYYIPDLQLPEETRPIGIWGRIHKDYLEQHHPVLYNDLILTGKLWTYHLNAGWFRLDSHFYEKKYIMLKQKLEADPHWYLKDLVEKPIQTGHTPSMKNASFYGGTIALIKTDNLRENFISDVFSDYLSEQGNAEIARTALQEDDIITTIIGATEDVIARSALITKRFLPANINQNIVQIRINQHIVSPAFVNAYFNSYYGRNYMQ